MHSNFVYGGVSIQARVNVTQGGGALGGGAVGGGAVGGAAGGGPPRANNVLMQALQQAQPVAGAPHQVRTTLSDGTIVNFRRDVGVHAHGLRHSGLPGDVDHYNIQVQSPAQSGRQGRYDNHENLHIVVNKDLQPIKVFNSQNKEVFNGQQLYNRSKP